MVETNSLFTGDGREGSKRGIPPTVTRRSVRREKFDRSSIVINPVSRDIRVELRGFTQASEGEDQNQF